MIYNSRNLIDVLDCRNNLVKHISTTVEILQTYQTIGQLSVEQHLQQQKSYRRIRHSMCCFMSVYLQQQKSYRRIRLCSTVVVISIYNSRNLIDVLDKLRRRLAPPYLQQQKSYRRIRQMPIFQWHNYLQQQKSYRRIRQNCCQIPFFIYNSRNLIDVLDISFLLVWC